MTVLGKRKAPGATRSAESAQDIFRRHFEAQFQPLDRAAKSKSKSAIQDEEDDDNDTSGADDHHNTKRTEYSEEEESEWGGLSDDENSTDHDEDQDATPAVEVIDHSVSQAPKQAAMSKRELKAFMSSRPPDQNAPTRPDPSAAQPASSTSSLPEDAPSLLAQDLELRRLISESHLLSSPSLTSPFAEQQPKAFAAGRVRLKTTDLRIQALGSKESIHTQQKMPMAMRKGIAAAADAREAKRRREARENNVVLERESSGKKKRSRDRSSRFGVDRPGVGRLKGAELRISERDVRSIEGTRDVFGRKGKR